jgi:hypothetical protein
LYYIKNYCRKTISLFIVLILLLSQVFCSQQSFSSTDRAIDKSINKIKENHIIVKYKKIVDEKGGFKNAFLESSVSESLSSIKEYKSIDCTLFRVPENVDIEALVKKLNKDPNVIYAQPDYKLHLDSTAEEAITYGQWGIKNERYEGIDINVLPLWEVTEGSGDIVVGVLDTGIENTHPDLVDNIFINTGEIPNDGRDNDRNGYIDDINGWDFYNHDNSVFDDRHKDDHGTHVAGIIAASTKPEAIVGVAPGVKILPLKFIDGENGGYTSHAIQAIDYAYNLGVRIVNCSWGSSDNNPALFDAMNISDMIFICSAGNEGRSLRNNPKYPASFKLPNIVTVANMTENGSLSETSNYGVDVDIAAPGDHIKSTIPHGTWGYMSGTSMAAPFVTGTVALLKSTGLNNLSPEALITRIKNSAEILTDLNGLVDSNGFIDAWAAYKGHKNYIPIPELQYIGTLDTIKLSWNSILNIQSYEIEVDGEIINTGLDRTYTHENLEPISRHVYRIRAKTNLGKGKWSRPTVAFTKPTGYRKLGFSPLNSVQHPTEPVIYFTEQDKSSVIEYNCSDKTIREINFDLPAENLAFENNELLVTLLRDEHSPFWDDSDQTGEIAIIDTDDFIVIDQFEINMDPYGIDIKNGCIYISGGSDQSTYVRSYSRETKTLLSTNGSINQGSNIEIHPKLSRLYASEKRYGSSHSTYDVFCFNDGIFTEKFDVYSGSETQYFKHDFKIAPNGNYIFNYTGYIYGCSNSREYEGEFVYNLNKEFTSIAFAPNRNEFYISTESKEIYVYDYTTFELKGKYYTLGDIYKIHYAQNRLFVFGCDDQNDDYYEIVFLNLRTLVDADDEELLSDGKRLLPEPTIIAETVQHPTESILYMADPIFNKVYKMETDAINADDYSYISEIELPYTPEHIVFENGKLYINQLKEDLSAEITVLDADNLRIIENYAIDENPRDIVIRDGHLYEFAQADNAQIHPSQDKVYYIEEFRDNYITSAYISEGDITEYINSPNYYKKELRKEFQISPDGFYLFISSGRVFGTSYSGNYDMKYICKLGESFRDITFSIKNNSFYTWNLDKSKIDIYNYGTFKKTGSYNNIGLVKYMHTFDDDLLLLKTNSSGLLYYKKIDLPNTEPDIVYEGLSTESEIAFPRRTIIADTIKHPDLPVFYAADPITNRIYKINHETNEISETMEFPWSPEKLCYEDNKLYSSLITSKTEGFVGKFEPETMEFLYRMDDDIYPKDYFIVDGIVKIINDNQKHGMQKHPLFNKFIYCNYANNLNIIDIDINNNEIIMTGSFNTYEYIDSRDYFFTPDGKRLISTAGRVYDFSSDSNEDFRYKFGFYSGYSWNNRISAFCFNTEDNKFYIATLKNKIFEYDYTTFEKTKEVELENTIKWFYYYEGQLISIYQQEDSGDIISSISVSDRMNQVFEEPLPEDTVRLYGNSDKAIYDTERHLSYVIDKGLDYLYIVDLVDDKIIKSLKLLYEPTAFCISETKNTLLIANKDREHIITEVDLTTHEIIGSYPFDTNGYHNSIYPTKIENMDGKIFVNFDTSLYIFDNLNTVSNDYLQKFDMIRDFCVSVIDNTPYLYVQRKEKEYHSSFETIEVYIANEESEFSLIESFEPSYPNRISGLYTKMPMILNLSTNSLILEGVVFDANDITTIKGDFIEEIYLVDNTDTLVIGKNNTYNLSSLEHVAAFLTGGNEYPAFFDKFNRLYTIKRFGRNLLKSYKTVAPFTGNDSIIEYDLNEDNSIDNRDFFRAKQRYNNSGDSSSDYNDDDIVDILDLVELFKRRTN